MKMRDLIMFSKVDGRKDIMQFSAYLFRMLLMDPLYCNSTIGLAACTLNKITGSVWILNPNKNWFAALHKKSMSTRLRKYGLLYDDLYDPLYDLDVKEALDRLPREVVDARNQRLLRAMDLSLKHEYLPEHLQAQQTPFRSYLQDMLALVKRERAEREALGALPLYQRTIP
ncbi:cytochrome b-c1 complex subunit 7-2, mitochondrial-like isoform X2 [Rutidosis leptorrhynchoides]|uniref:cytochrome b-c1 complex subunit 7-2, mitochondrial-like isoform X2 n=1 Tax=Rutidosis leptorrhynchoides TaxID=125765 RepID=UPI003A99E8BD